MSGHGWAGTASAAIMPTTGPDPDSLRNHVRLWLAKGLLPAPGDQAWAGPGTGKLCVVCALVVGAVDTECEVGYGAGRLYAHLSCYTLWQEEAALRDTAPYT